MSKAQHSTVAKEDRGSGSDAGRIILESAVVRFAGDSGDGIQLTGGQFTQATAIAGNDLATFPNYPAEIRAPIGTTFGVSSFQINFGSSDIETSGDQLDTLVAMNPAALAVELPDLKPGGTIIVDSGSFGDRNLRKAGYEVNPLEDGSLDHYTVVELDISKMTLEALKDSELSKKDALRCKNMWTLGLVYWMFGRQRQATVDWLREKFSSRPDIADANIAALNAGHAFGETAELPGNVTGYVIQPAHIAPGLYRAVTGAEALSWGMVVGSNLVGLRPFLGSYPITPASNILHTLSGLKEYGVVTFQAEDEIAAVCSAIGASYAGMMGMTSSSGPGVALKTEALGLAIGVELPLVVINCQRAGPSTGLPTKTEQSDLFQAVLGRNADSPLAVLAPSSPADSFDIAIEAVRIAARHMTPVIVLADGYIVNAAEPWLIPDVDAMEKSPVEFLSDPEGFHPYMRDEKTGAPAWVRPGTPGTEHRIGGLEKDYETGNISYNPENHQRMTDVRFNKIACIADDIPAQEVASGKDSGRLAIVGWGSTYGPIAGAVANARADGLDVSHIHIRYLNPFPKNLGDLLGGFDQVLVPEMNAGQLTTLLRAEYLIPAEGLNKVTGQPFKISEIEAAIHEQLEA